MPPVLRSENEPPGKVEEQPLLRPHGYILSRPHRPDILFHPEDIPEEISQENRPKEDSQN